MLRRKRLGSGRDSRSDGLGGAETWATLQCVWKGRGMTSAIRFCVWVGLGFYDQRRAVSAIHAGQRRDDQGVSAGGRQTGQKRRTRPGAPPRRLVFFKPSLLGSLRSVFVTDESSFAELSGPSRFSGRPCDPCDLDLNVRRPRRFWSRGWLLLSPIVIFFSKTHMSCRAGAPAPARALSWGRRHAPPPLKKQSFLSLPSTRRLRRFGQLVFHTSLLGDLFVHRFSGSLGPVSFQDRPARG